MLPAGDLMQAFTREFSQFAESNPQHTAVIL
jgi:hypothetical protein